MGKFVWEHRDIPTGEIHGVVNWVVDTLNDLGEIPTKQSDRFKLARIENDGNGSAIYILTDQVTVTDEEQLIIKYTMYWPTIRSGTQFGVIQTNDE